MVSGYEALLQHIGWLSSVGWFEFEAGADGVGAACSGGSTIAALSPKTKFIFSWTKAFGGKLRVTLSLSNSSELTLRLVED